MVGEPELGVLAVEEAGEGAYGFFNRLVESSATWGRAMDRMSFCVSLANGVARLNMVHDRSKVMVVLEPGNGVRTGMDLMSTAVCLRTRAHMGEAISPLEVRYACPKPRKTVEYERVFGVPVEFEATRTELVYDRSLYDTPVPRARTEVGDLLEALVLRAANALSVVTSASRESAPPPTQNSSAFLTEVTLALQVCIEQGTAQLSNVARAMGLSSRSLQRYLRESQCSFRELVGQQRAELAARSAALRSKAATARLLGYSDRRALRRAETRWSDDRDPLCQEPGAEGQCE
jgi:AraC-like DNA-binding protein